MSRPTHDIVATIGEYTNSNGEKKRRYVNCGKAFTGDSGISLKIDSLPAGPGWNGWLSLYPVREENNPPPSRSTAAATPPHREEDEDDIPF